MDYGWLNVLSLVLGLMAIALPLININLPHKYDRKRYILSTIASMGSCTMALFFQMIYTWHLIVIRDWTALMDTQATIVLCALILIAGTVLVNVLTYVHERTKL